MFSDLMRLPCRRASCHRTPFGGSIATAQWQHCHRPVAALPPPGVRWQSYQKEMEQPKF